MIPDFMLLIFAESFPFLIKTLLALGIILAFLNFKNSFDLSLSSMPRTLMLSSFLVVQTHEFSCSIWSNDILPFFSVKFRILRRYKLVEQKIPLIK